jgi:hypothetical protein
MADTLITPNPQNQQNPQTQGSVAPLQNTATTASQLGSSSLPPVKDQVEVSTEDLFENEGVATQQEVDEINASLGLVMPDGILTETIPVWKKFFYMIRKMIATDSIKEEQIPGLIEKFNKVPDGNKIEMINSIYEKYLKFLDDSEVLKDLWYAEDLKDAYEEFIALMPEKERIRIQHLIETGEDLDIDAINQELRELESVLGAETAQRAAEYLLGTRKGGFRVDADNERAQYTTSARGGSVLNPDELEERLSVEDERENIQSEEEIQAQPARAPRAPGQPNKAPQLVQPDTGVSLPPRRSAPTLEQLTQRKQAMTKTTNPGNRQPQQNVPSQPIQRTNSAQPAPRPQPAQQTNPNPQGPAPKNPKTPTIPGGQKPMGTLDDLLNK